LQIAPPGFYGSSIRNEHIAWRYGLRRMDGCDRRPIRTMRG
jgi:hypothetical protein